MKFMSEDVYVDCVECFAHVLQSSTTVIVRSGVFFSGEACFDGVVYVV